MIQRDLRPSGSSPNCSHDGRWDIYRRSTWIPAFAGMTARCSLSLRERVRVRVAKACVARCWIYYRETGSLISITGGAKRPCGLRLYSSVQRSPLVMNSNGPVHLFSGFAWCNGPNAFRRLVINSMRISFVPDFTKGVMSVSCGCQAIIPAS